MTPFLPLHVLLMAGLGLAGLAPFWLDLYEPDTANAGIALFCGGGVIALMVYVRYALRVGWGSASMLYLALFPDQKGNHLHRGFFMDAPNRLLAIVPDAVKWKDVVKVVDVGFLPSHRAVKLRADAVAQKVLCYLDRAPAT